MRIEYDQFIGTFTEVYPEGFCTHLVEEFDRFQKNGLCINRQQEDSNTSKAKKDDFSLFCNGKNLPFENFNEEDPVGLFFRGLQECYAAYEAEYPYIDQGQIRCHRMRLQKTCPGGGYHLWHSEQAADSGRTGSASSRVLVYMLYLNTLEPEECGETEFLYQQKRMRPTENTMVLWPAAFTHPHRGNPVYGKRAKYIITGWFQYDE